MVRITKRSNRRKGKGTKGTRVKRAKKQGSSQRGGTNSVTSASLYPPFGKFSEVEKEDVVIPYVSLKEKNENVPNKWLSDHQIYTATVNVKGIEIKCAVFNMLSKSVSDKVEVDEVIYQTAKKNFEEIFDKINVWDDNFEEWWKTKYENGVAVVSSTKDGGEGEDVAAAIGTGNIILNYYENINNADYLLKLYNSEAKSKIFDDIKKNNGDNGWIYNEKSLPKKGSSDLAHNGKFDQKRVKELFGFIHGKSDKQKWGQKLAQLLAGGEMGGFEVYSPLTKSTHDDFQGGEKKKFVQDQINILTNSGSGRGACDIIVLPECDTEFDIPENYTMVYAGGGGVPDDVEGVYEPVLSNESKGVLINQRKFNKLDVNSSLVHHSKLHFDLILTLKDPNGSIRVRCVHASSLSEPKLKALTTCWLGKVDNGNIDKPGLVDILDIKNSGGTRATSFDDINSWKIIGDNLPDIILGDFNIPPGLTGDNRWGVSKDGHPIESGDIEDEMKSLNNFMTKNFDGFDDFPDDVIPKTRSSDTFINVQAPSGKVYNKRRYNTDFVLVRKEGGGEVNEDKQSQGVQGVQGVQETLQGIPGTNKQEIIKFIKTDIQTKVNELPAAQQQKIAKYRLYLGDNGLKWYMSVLFPIWLSNKKWVTANICLNDCKPDETAPDEEIKNIISLILNHNVVDDAHENVGVNLGDVGNFIESIISKELIYHPPVVEVGPAGVDSLTQHSPSLKN